MRLNKSKVVLSKMVKSNIEEVVKMSKSDALLFVWDLTQEVYSFTRTFDAKSRLQRDVISIIRK